MNSKYKEHVSIIMPKGGKKTLHEKLDALGIKRSEGIREILVAFNEGRCTIKPSLKNDGIKKLYTK